jgi:hypothetical protein
MLSSFSVADDNVKFYTKLHKISVALKQFSPSTLTMQHNEYYLNTNVSTLSSVYGNLSKILIQPH